MRDAISDMFKNAFKGSSTAKGPIKVTTSVKHSTPKPKPRFARKDLLRELVCDHCGRDYGLFAIGLFCPDCGAPNLRLHFSREVELVDAQVSLAKEIEAHKEELAYRLLGNAHEDVLTAFEATLKTVYLYGQSQAKLSQPKVGNDFQNVDRALKRFGELNLNPFEQLTEPELATLQLNIQKRHIIGHNLGVVDNKFAAHANDAKVGETVGLVGADIQQFAAIGQKVVDSLDSWLCGSPSPTIKHSASLMMMITEPTMDSNDPKGLMALDLQLSLLARKVALWVAEHCPDGSRNFVDANKLREEFKENSEEQLDEAIAELTTDGYVELSRTLGGGLPHFRPSLDLYLTFDGLAFGRDPIADIVTVAELALAGSDSVNTEGLFAQTGWDVRRFNPALEYIATQIPDGRVGRHMGTKLSVSFFHLLAEDRVQVKRLVARFKS